MVSGKVHFTCAPDLASDSWSAMALARMSGLVSTAMKVRVRGILSSKFQVPSSRFVRITT